jgi:hypothetical protein
MYFNELVSAYDEARRERNIFHDLMRFRVREVLLVASLYDSFVVESDGVLTEQIYGEYFKLNLNTVPRVTSAYTSDSALELFREDRFDLVILIAGLDFERPLRLARAMKAARPEVPVLLMVTNNASLASLDAGRSELAVVDRTFVWNGYSKLFVGMLKYVEDMRNVDADTRTGLVRVILLIEDSVRYYSRYLPLLYQTVQRQTQALIEEEKGDETYKLLCSRARPKVLLASSWEEATGLFERYEPYMLTVISDLRFPRGGKLDGEAGFEFLRMAKGRIEDLPTVLQSSEAGVKEKAYAMGAAFVDKNSESLEHELGNFLRDNLGFGPFRFRGPGGEVIAEARNMEEFITKLMEVPPESVLHHAARNHFSTWLTARGEIKFAKVIRPYQVEDFGSIQDLRGFILRVLEEARRVRAQGSVPSYDETFARAESSMTRLGDGSVGGKGRGIVFIRSLLENLGFAQYLPGIEVKMPRTAFVGIDEFERFLERNGLWAFAFYEAGAGEVRERFLRSPLGEELVGKLRRFLRVTERPLAVRSSGLFEDMLMVPFSGIYDTYIVPNDHEDEEVRLGQLCDAVRLIYASLFSEKSRAYFEMAGYNLEEERMGVVVQELVGSRKGRWFYPQVSGTAQSFNYYPVGYLKPEDGLCVAALGLGSYVVDGGAAYRFCPRYPKIGSYPERLKAASQKVFWALDMEDRAPDLSAGEDATLVELDITEAEADRHFSLLASTWDAANDRLAPGIAIAGQRIMDFGAILKYGSVPFAGAVDMVLDLGAQAMGTPVEIEYALSLDEPSGVPALYLLQIKPLIRNEDRIDVDLDETAIEDCFIVSERSMGNGRITAVEDVIYVDPARFDRAATRDIGLEIEFLNSEIGRCGRRYLLVGPGRWGTRDPWLGIPVLFSWISHARVIVEADLPGYSVESSLGSHFFHNVTSMNIGYLTVPADNGPSRIDWAWLGSFEPVMATAHCAWVRLPEALDIIMDGRKSHAMIRKRVVPAGDLPASTHLADSAASHE